MNSISNIKSSAHLKLLSPNLLFLSKKHLCPDLQLFVQLSHSNALKHCQEFWNFIDLPDRTYKGGAGRTGSRIGLDNSQHTSILVLPAILFLLLVLLVLLQVVCSFDGFDWVRRRITVGLYWLLLMSIAGIGETLDWSIICLCVFTFSVTANFKSDHIFLWIHLPTEKVRTTVPIRGAPTMLT